MNCTKFIDEISMYLDNMLDAEEKTDFEKHLDTCKTCSIEFNNLKIMLECVNEIEEIDLPSDFEAALHDRLIKETEAAKRKPPFLSRVFHSRVKIAGGMAAAIAVVVISIATVNHFSTGSGMRMTYEAPTTEYSAGQSEESAEDRAMTPLDAKNDKAITFSNQISPATTAEPRVGSGQNASIGFAQSERKIIKQAALRIETDSFDASYEKILKMVDERQGFVQHSETYYRIFDRENPDASLRTSHMVLRIPSKDFNQFFNQVKTFGKVISENIGGQDITDYYRDIEREVANLEIQEERFREILMKADRVEDVLKIENEIARVRGQINSLKASLYSFDKQVEMSTLTLDLEEVKSLEAKIQVTNDGVWQRAKNSFINTVNGMIDLSQRLFIGFFGVLPALAILGAIAGPLSIYVYKQIKKRRN